MREDKVAHFQQLKGSSVLASYLSTANYCKFTEIIANLKKKLTDKFLITLSMWHISEVFSAFGAMFTDLWAMLGAWYPAKVMHDHMLRAIVWAPVLFFDTTPAGRIIARFSKDIDVMDTSLPFQIADSIFCFFQVA